MLTDGGFEDSVGWSCIYVEKEMIDEEKISDAQLNFAVALVIHEQNV